MEYKNCEQYVLCKLEEAENEIEQLKSEADAMSELLTQEIKHTKEVDDLNSVLMVENAKLTKLLKAFKNCATICQEDSSLIISADKEDFDYLISVLKEENK